MVPDARRCELLISVQIKLFRRLSDLLHPRLELFTGNRIRLEMHVSETSTGELLILTGISPRFISQEMQSGLHACHGVNLAAQLRNEEGSHYGVGGDFEADRNIDGKSDLIDSRDILIRVDEEPFPIQAYDFDVDGLVDRRDGLVRIQRMGPGPSQNRKNRDNGKGNPPHEKIDFSGMTPFRHISRFGIGYSVL